MRAVDSGVAVAAFASWHESHQAAFAELSGRPQIASHSLIETFSVLTRLPAPHRAPAELVSRFLDAAFPEDPLTIDGRLTRLLVVDRLPAVGVSGGATYDALIAETVRAAGATLVTLDRRALATYDRIGCEAVLIE
ncbi:MAG: PIN domain-containing protein [Actinomycetota bacterium]|nr:PIN domain-containing protein [Actinomycetota bacterium]